MKLANDIRFQPLQKGANVLVPVSDVDKSKGDSRNLIGKSIINIFFLLEYFCILNIIRQLIIINYILQALF